jgi:hypothetical protein
VDRRRQLQYGTGGLAVDLSRATSAVAVATKHGSLRLTECGPVSMTQQFAKST